MKATTTVPAQAVSDAVIHDLVRCLRQGGASGFGFRVYAAAESRGLIAWDEKAGRFIAVGS